MKKTLALIAFLLVVTNTFSQTAYNYQENAERLYKRANEALSYQFTIPEMAYTEKLTYAGRNIFMVYGAHFNPLHIRNMA